MKSYLVKKIHLKKYLFLLIISFLAISILTILINQLTIGIEPNIILIFNAIVFAFFILPKIKKASSIDLIVKINNQKIHINEFELELTKIDSIKINFEFTISPKIVIGFNNGDKYTFRVLKPAADYLSLVNELNIINNSKLIRK